MIDVGMAIVCRNDGGERKENDGCGDSILKAFHLNPSHRSHWGAGYLRLERLSLVVAQLGHPTRMPSRATLRVCFFLSLEYRDPLPLSLLRAFFQVLAGIFQEFFENIDFLYQVLIVRRGFLEDGSKLTLEDPFCCGESILGLGRVFQA